MVKILITCGRFSFEAELFDTNTAQMIRNELPLQGVANIWGEEIYFPVTFTAEIEDGAKEEVEVGTIAYWPPGKAFCIFFGPTPVSTSAKPRAYSPVNICGQILGPLNELRAISPGEKIKLEIVKKIQPE
jgi:hypothetical protein